MKKLALLLAFAVVFTLTAVAQEGGQEPSSSSQSSTTTTTTKKKSSHKKGAMSDMDAMGASGKTASLTGCVSQQAGSDGMFTLATKRKKEIEIGPTDKVQEHAGHEVKLSGHWATPSEIGEKSSASSGSEKGERHFEVDNVTHIADTCTAAAGSAMASNHKAHKKPKSETPQQQQ